MELETFLAALHKLDNKEVFEKFKEALTLLINGLDAMGEDFDIGTALEIVLMDLEEMLDEVDDDDSDDDNDDEEDDDFDPDSLEDDDDEE